MFKVRFLNIIVKEYLYIVYSKMDESREVKRRRCCSYLKHRPFDIEDRLILNQRIREFGKGRAVEKLRRLINEKKRKREKEKIEESRLKKADGDRFIRKALDDRLISRVKRTGKSFIDNDIKVELNDGCITIYHKDIVSFTLI
jgi:hypothetical protein